MPYIIKIDSLIPPNENQTKNISCYESLNTTFLSSEIPSNVKTPESNIINSSSINFSTLKLEPHQSKKLSTQITKMRKYLLNNSF